jgi:hypothetical protein
MIIKYKNIFHSKALQNKPKLGISGLKTNHLATLLVATFLLQGPKTSAGRLGVP